MTALGEVRAWSSVCCVLLLLLCTHRGCKGVRAQHLHLLCRSCARAACVLAAGMPPAPMCALHAGSTLAAGSRATVQLGCTDEAR